MNYPNAKYELQEAIESFLNLYYVNKNRDSIIEKAKDTIGLSKIIDILNRDLPLTMLPDDDLYYLVKACHSFYLENANEIKFNINLLKADKYFDAREIDKITSSFVIPEQHDSEFYVFHNVTKVDDMQYMIPRMTEKEIIDLIYGGFVKYDRTLQRESEKVVKNNVSYERVKVYAKSKREIKQSMKEGTYRPTALSINILNRDDGSDISDIPDELLETHFYYDEEEKTLTISKKDRVSLIDGMHRLYALIESYNEQTPEQPFNQIMQMNVFFMTAKQAKKYIYQEGQKNPISKEQLQRLNSSNIYIEFAEKLCNMGDNNTNLLKDKIGTESKDVSMMHKFTTIGKLAEAISDNFIVDPKDIREQRLLSNYLIKFFNELFSIYKEDANDIEASRRNNIRMTANMIYAYICIAKQIRDVPNWESTLEVVLELIDTNFSENFKDITQKYEVSKKSKKSIYDYLENLIK